MKKMLLAVCAISVAFAGSAQAIEKPGLGALKNVTNVVSNAASSLTPTSVRGTIGTINDKLSAADKTVQASFNALVSALASKEEATKIKAELNAINANKNLSASEKSAKIAGVMSDYGNTLKETQDEMGEKLKTASAEKRAAITAAVIDLSAASVQYLDIANDCKSIVMSVSSNPTLAVSLAPELASLKDTGVILKNNVKSLKDVTTTSVAVAKAGGIEIKLPSVKATKAKKADF